MSPADPPSRSLLAIAVGRSLAALVALLIGYFAAPIGESGWQIVTRSAVALLVLAIVVVVQTLAVRRSQTPGVRALEALTVSASLLLIVSATIHLGISADDPGAFTEPLGHVDALYVSMMTMTTVGFGDIGTVSQGARIAVMVQMLCNFVVLGVVARVVLRYAQRGEAPESGALSALSSGTPSSGTRSSGIRSSGTRSSGAESPADSDDAP